MYARPSSSAEFHQMGMDALIEFAHAHFAAFERLSALNFNVARSAFKDSTTYAKALLVTKDTPEFSRLSAQLALPAVDRTIVYSLGLCELASKAQRETARLFDVHASGFGKSLATELDKVSAYAPAGSGIAVKAVKSALDIANSAFGSLTEFGIKASEFAQATLAAVTADVATADAKSDKANGKSSKTAKTSKGGKGSRQASKGTRRKAA